MQAVLLLGVQSSERKTWQSTGNVVAMKKAHILVLLFYCASRAVIGAMMSDHRLTGCYLLDKVHKNIVKAQHVHQSGMVIWTWQSSWMGKVDALALDS